MKRLIAFLATKAKDEPNEVRSALLCLIRNHDNTGMKNLASTARIDGSLNIDEWY